MSRLCHQHPTSFPRRAILLTALVIFATSCSSDRDQPNPQARETQLAEPVLPAPAAASPDVIPSTSADTIYSDAPGCNALVNRIADEMVPCLARINPEYSERLQAMIDSFRTTPNTLLDPIRRDEVVKQTEEDCQTHWRQIVNQFGTNSPEGRCRFEIKK